IFRKCSCINEFSKSLVVNGYLNDFLKNRFNEHLQFCSRVHFKDISAVNLYFILSAGAFVENFQPGLY
ncbi:MAG TPA: hypothetical protein VIV35_03535, partial [Chitinophagaceae bacterium]